MKVIHPFPSAMCATIIDLEIAIAFRQCFSQSIFHFQTCSIMSTKYDDVISAFKESNLNFPQFFSDCARDSMF